MPSLKPPTGAGANVELRISKHVCEVELAARNAGVAGSNTSWSSPMICEKASNWAIWRRFSRLGISPLPPGLSH